MVQLDSLDVDDPLKDVRPEKVDDEQASHDDHGDDQTDRLEGVVDV